MKAAAVLIVAFTAPAAAATGPFLSLGNTTFVVLISFLLFIGALFYFKAPGFAGKLIDSRIEIIRKQLDEAAMLRAEAAETLSKAEQANAESREHADRMIRSAQEEAKNMIAEGEKGIRLAVERRLRAAEDQIASAEAAAVTGIRNEAIEIAINAAGQVIAAKMTDDDRTAMFNKAIGDIEANLH